MAKWTDHTYATEILVHYTRKAVTINNESLKIIYFSYTHSYLHYASIALVCIFYKIKENPLKT